MRAQVLGLTVPPNYQPFSSENFKERAMKFVCDECGKDLDVLYLLTGYPLCDECDLALAKELEDFERRDNTRKFRLTYFHLLYSLIALIVLALLLYLYWGASL